MRLSKILLKYSYDPLLIILEKSGCFVTQTLSGILTQIRFDLQQVFSTSNFISTQQLNLT